MNMVLFFTLISLIPFAIFVWFIWAISDLGSGKKTTYYENGKKVWFPKLRGKDW